MRVSYNWLKEYLDFNSSIEEISEILTNSGLEVEKATPFFNNFDSFSDLVIGYVVACKQHPNADKLKIVQVDIGKSIKNIICGASNIKKDVFVVVAKSGTTITNLNNESFTISKVKIRGEYSEGMICSEFEIGIGSSNEGVMILNKNLKLKSGQGLVECLNLKQDYFLEIGLTPNRTDAFGHIGVCRDIKSVLNLQGYHLELKLPDVEFKNDNTELPILINVKDMDICPFYCGVTIQNVSVSESPMWLKQKLNSIGISSVNNVVDITNFVLFETGNPLHAFDYDLIDHNELVIKKVENTSLFKKIDGEEIKLHKDDLIISDSAKPLCLAGIIGGQESCVTKETKNIFLESAYFLPSSIRRSSKRHGIQTDASYRFERGVDIGNCEFALKRAALLIKSIIPESQISSKIVSIFDKKTIKKKSIKWSFEKFEKLLGQKIQKSIIEKILIDLDFKILGKDGLIDGCFLEVPSYRVDVYRDVDVFEEVLRIFGFGKINNSKNISFPVSNSHNSYESHNVKEKVSNFLSNIGFFEIKTNSLVSSKILERYHVLNNSIKIINAVSSDMNVLRPSILFGGLESVRYNLNRQNRNLLFFEFGNIYFKDKKIIEKPFLDLFFTGDYFDENWNQSSKKLDLFSIKGFVKRIFNLFFISNSVDFKQGGIESLVFLNNKQKIFKKSMLYKIEEKVIAQLGSLSDDVLKDFNIKEDVFYCSIDWSFFISNIKRDNVKFKKLPKFPKVRRDLAIVINENVSFLELQTSAFKISENLLKEVIIFDIFRGKNIEKGKKSYALGFIFQDENKTLTDQLVDEIIKKIYHNFKDKFSAKLRDGEL